MPFRYVSVYPGEAGGCTQVVPRSVNLFTLPQENLQGGLGPQPTRVSGRRSSYFRTQGAFRAYEERSRKPTSTAGRSRATTRSGGCAISGPPCASETPPYWARPSVPLGHHEPVWRARTLRPRLPSVDSSPNRAYRAILQTLGTLAQPRVWSASLTPFREFSSLVIGRLRVSEVRGRYGRRWRESETRL